MYINTGVVDMKYLAYPQMLVYMFSVVASNVKHQTHKNLRYDLNGMS